jgi:hypothetical protein
MRGGAQSPPTVAMIVVVIVNDSGGRVGANNQRPMPHAAKGWPTDNAANIVVRFPPVVHSPTQLLPILRVILFVVVIVFVVVVVKVEQALPIVFPTSTPLSLPSCYCLQLNARANPSRSLNMYNPWSAHRMPITRLAVLSPDDVPNQMITSLGIIVVVIIVVIVICPPPPRPPPCCHCCCCHHCSTPPWHPLQACCSSRQSMDSAHPIDGGGMRGILEDTVQDCRVLIRGLPLAIVLL